MKPLLFLIVIILLSGCAYPRSGASAGLESLRIGDAVVRLRYSPDDVETASQIRRVLHRAVPAAERWGKLSAAVLVTIHPTHEALEGASHREGYAWLRAWARRAAVELQSPRTWSRGTASDAEMAQLLTHELTHCAMYQAVSNAGAERGIPLWFREGMASVAAGDRRGGPDEIRRFYREAAGAEVRPAGDPLTEPERLYRSQAAVVYATAHRAFGFLLDRYGEARIRRIMAAMGEGQGFGEAFRQATGIPLQDFEGEFKRYIVWGGWRGEDDRRADGSAAAEPEAPVSEGWRVARSR